MKKILFLILCAFLSSAAKADDPKRADIKFEQTTIDLGKFGRETPIRKCAFVFTNTGDADLYIHQIFTSCRCTGKEYPTHAKTEMTKVYIKGEMLPAKIQENEVIEIEE